MSMRTMSGVSRRLWRTASSRPRLADDLEVRLEVQDLAQPHLSPAALQAWQISLSEWRSSAGIVLLLFAVAVAGIGYRAVPRWLAWTGLLLAVVQLFPVERVAF